MPRAVELTGVTIGLRIRLVPQTGDDGQLIHASLGGAKLAEVLDVVATDPKTGDTTAVPLSEQMFHEFAVIVASQVKDDTLKQKMVETLTGGITVPRVELPAGARA